MVRRYAAGTAAGAALIVSLAGCQGDSGGDKGDGVKVSAAQAIDMASQKTSKVDTYKVDLTENGKGQSASKMHAVVQVRLRPDVAATGTLDQAAFGGFSMPGGARAILLGDNVYGKVPQQLTQFTGGKPWVRLSLSRAGQQPGANIDEVLRQANPAEQTKIFTGSKDVHQVGTESINGVKTTHYRGSITPQEAATRLDPKARKSFQEFYQRTGAGKLGFDLWVGADNLPRKLVSKVTASEGTATVTMIFSDYNKSFTVTAPPANQVADADQLKNSFGGQGTPKLPG